MDYTLRPAHPDDLEIVLPWAGTADLLRRWGGPSLAFPGNPKSIWVEIEASPDNTRSLIDANREVVGFGQALRRGRNIHLARIIVSPDHRGHGLGLILCRRLIQQAIHGHRPDEITLKRPPRQCCGHGALPQPWVSGPRPVSRSQKPSGCSCAQSPRSPQTPPMPPSIPLPSS